MSRWRITDMNSRLLNAAPKAQDKACAATILSTLEAGQGNFAANTSARRCRARRMIILEIIFTNNPTPN